jgi:diacylglycerol kinase (ATP)
MPSFRKALRSRAKSIRIAIGGIKHVLVTQHNAWIHGAISLVVILLGLILDLARWEWVSLFLVMGLVWMAEIFNTAVELMVDMVNPQPSQIAKLVKDVSAGAVLFCALISVVVGLLVLGPNLLDLLSSLFNR